MLWIMRLRGGNANRISSASETRPARREYNQLSSKETISSSKSYTARRTDTYFESNNGNDSCSDSNSDCTDVEDSNVNGDRCDHRKKEIPVEDPNNNPEDSQNNNDPSKSTSKSQRLTRGSRSVFSDDSDYDEALTCNVCDRTFPSQRLLDSHQQKKRHFGCSTCDSLYLSLMALEHHKEEFQHWSDEDEYCSAGYASDSSEDTIPSEDCERLL